MGRNKCYGGLELKMKLFTQNNELQGDEEGQKVYSLISDLWWGRDRWDSSTEDTMNEIADLLLMPKEDEDETN